MGKTYKILFVEAEYKQRFVVMKLLSDYCDCEIETALNYEEAMICLKKHWFDLVIVGMDSEFRSEIGAGIFNLIESRQLEKMPLMGLSANKGAEGLYHAGNKLSFWSILTSLFAKEPAVNDSESNFDKVYTYPLTQKMLKDDFLGSLLEEKVVFLGAGKKKFDGSRELLAAFQVLDLNPYSTLGEVKSRYRALVKKYHPDGGGDDPEAMQEINDAYQIVRDSIKT